MAYEYDRFEREEGGGSFLMGLLAGTVLGAGLGMLFAPKSGSELRSQIGTQIADQTGKLREVADPLYQQATEKVQQATEKVSQIVDRGREAYDRARSSVGNMAAAGTSGASSSSGTTVSTGSTGTPGTTSTSGGVYGV
jgi:gas vesicle protein